VVYFGLLYLFDRWFGPAIALLPRYTCHVSFTTGCEMTYIIIMYLHVIGKEVPVLYQCPHSSAVLLIHGCLYSVDYGIVRIAGGLVFDDGGHRMVGSVLQVGQDICYAPSRQIS
jgi:hypothetical protein